MYVRLEALPFFGCVPGRATLWLFRPRDRDRATRVINMTHIRGLHACSTGIDAAAESAIPARSWKKSQILRAVSALVPGTLARSA